MYCNEGEDSFTYGRIPFTMYLWMMIGFSSERKERRK